MNDIQKMVEASQLTPGQILKAEREAKKININEVVQRLLLSKKVITAIEEDDYSRIPARVYAEGYLKAYAQFLQIPVITVLESFRRLNIYAQDETQAETKKHQQINKLQQFSDLLKRHDKWHLVLVVAIVLMLIMLLIFMSKQFVRKKTEATNIPSISHLSNMTGNDVLLEKQIPIITTTVNNANTNAENIVLPTADDDNDT